MLFANIEKKACSWFDECEEKRFSSSSENSEEEKKEEKKESSSGETFLEELLRKECTLTSKLRKTIAEKVRRIV